MNLLARLLKFLFGSRAVEERPQWVSTPPASPPAPAAPASTPRSAASAIAAVLPEAMADPYFAAPSAPDSPAAKAAVRAKGSLGLEANAYLPITRKEIKAAAKGINRFGNP